MDANDLDISSQTENAAVDDISIAQEWLEDTQTEGVVDVLKITANALREVKSLRTPRSMKLIVRLTAVAEYFKLRKRLELHPRCNNPAISASLKLARSMGKGPYFARQVRETEHYLRCHGRLPLAKRERQGGHHTLLDRTSWLVRLTSLNLNSRITLVSLHLTAPLHTKLYRQMRSM